MRTTSASAIGLALLLGCAEKDEDRTDTTLGSDLCRDGWAPPCEYGYTGTGTGAMITGTGSGQPGTGSGQTGTGTGAAVSDTTLTTDSAAASVTDTAPATRTDTATTDTGA